MTDAALPIFSITKKKDGLLVHHQQTGRVDYLSWFEGVLYRVTGRIPNRFFKWHDAYLDYVEEGRTQ
tara:strand:- start:2930 stop:3130 length:201 start_codon:yes stop_codon:yes gene_type:complete